MRPHSNFASEADRLACREMIRAGSLSFFAASLVLPIRVREAAYALYAFCRLSDDMVDVDGGSYATIQRLRTRLDMAYVGRPADSCVDRAFADLIADFALPRALPEALIDGLLWDVENRAYETLGDVYAYAARVAGTVGAMMTTLMGARDPDVLARACDLGVAMQLTNIARDVGEDARNGRLYLPRAWLRDEGIDPNAWLANPAWRPEIGRVVARLLTQADLLYRRAESGIGGLPLNCRPGILAARYLYAAIGAEVAHNGFNSIATRARVPALRKMRLFSVALWHAAWPRSINAEPALAEVQYLVDAGAAARVPTPSAGPVVDRVLWVAELFADLRARDRGLQSRA